MKMKLTFIIFGLLILNGIFCEENLDKKNEVEDLETKGNFEVTEEAEIQGDKKWFLWQRCTTQTFQLCYGRCWKCTVKYYSYKKGACSPDKKMHCV